MITAITGPDGAGKTLLMTYFCGIQLSHKGRVLAFPGYKFTEGGKELSEPLPLEKWITLPPDLNNVLVAIDEIDSFFGSDRYMTWINKIFTNVAKTQRHRKLGIIYTLQEWEDLDPRIRKTTNIFIECTDAYWSRSGKADGLQRGDIIDYNVWDARGTVTGRRWQLMARKRIGSQAHPARESIGPHFDTYSDVDIWAGLTQIEVKKPKLTIDLTDGEEAPVKKRGNKSQALVSSSEELINALTKADGVDQGLVRKTAMALKRMEGGDDN